MKIILKQKAFLKLKYFAEHAKGEISGLGTCDISDGEILVDDVEIFKQDVSLAHTTLDSDEVAKFFYNKHKKNEDVSRYHLWWHSHADMSSYFSPTDEETIEREAMTGKPFLISIVTNKKEEMLGRLDIFKPKRFIINCKIQIEEIYDPLIEMECKREIKKKVKSFKPIYRYPQRNAFNFEHINKQLKSIIELDEYGNPLIPF